MTTHQRPGPPGFDEEAFQKALANLDRILASDDNSDTSWQESLPEAPDFPEGPEDTIAIIVSGGDGGQKPARRRRSGVARAGHHRRCNPR